jgi:hypothetical protein
MLARARLTPIALALQQLRMGSVMKVSDAGGWWLVVADGGG